jgi:hypothetical protein
MTHFNNKGKGNGYGGLEGYRDGYGNGFYHPKYKNYTSWYQWYSCPTEDCWGVYCCGESPPDSCKHCKKAVSWTQPILGPLPVKGNGKGKGKGKGGGGKGKGKSDGAAKGQLSKPTQTETEKKLLNVLEKVLTTVANDEDKLALEQIFEDEGIELPRVEEPKEECSADQLYKQLDAAKKDKVKNIEKKNTQLRHLQNLLNQIHDTETRISD